MSGSRFSFVASIVAVLALGVAPGTQARPGPKASPPGQGTLQVGAASRTVLPLVNGGYDYLAEGFPARDDAYDPGILVPAWDDGRIAVGNGEPESLWVRDDIRATALAIDDPRSEDIVVIVATDLYMVFRTDGRAYGPRPPRCCRRARRRNSRSSCPRRTIITAPIPRST
jgi:hypothetical protein